MARMMRKVALLGLAAGLTGSGFAQGPGQEPARPGAARKVMKSPKRAPAQPQPQVEPQVQAPIQPVVPPRPYQMAPVAPQVTYQNGQLSILAQNSTLSSILSAVRASTGAQVDMPPDTANDRVAVQLGPGNPRDVLASLLQGSRFDYIVIGSPTNPDALSQVILTVHSGSGGASASSPASPLTRGGSAQLNMPRIAEGAGHPEINAEEDETAVEPQVMPQPPPSQPPVETGAPQPGMAQPPGYSSQGLSPGVDPSQQQNPNQVKTPEQLLQDLQKMQQLQQQQQQQPQGAKQPQQQ